jgi:hypothetical protein
VAQRLAMDAEIGRHLRDRSAGLEHERTLLLPRGGRRAGARLAAIEGCLQASYALSGWDIELSS